MKQCALTVITRIERDQVASLDALLTQIGDHVNDNPYIDFSRMPGVPPAPRRASPPPRAYALARGERSASSLPDPCGRAAPARCADRPPPLRGGSRTCAGDHAGGSP